MDAPSLERKNSPLEKEAHESGQSRRKSERLILTNY